jgi:hypothetical protein
MAALERPSIFSAIATRKNRVNTYYRDISNMDQGYLRSVPSTVLPMSQAITQRDTLRTVIHPKPTGAVTGHQQYPPPQPGGTPVAEHGDSTGKQGKQKTFCIAVCPVLQYTSSTLAGTVNPAALLKTLRPTPKFPSVDTAGTAATGAKYICFAFTTAGTHHKGCSNATCRFVHLDADSMPTGTLPVHFASLKAAILGPLASAYEFTPAGVQLSL